MKSARNLIPKKLGHATSFHDGSREHHSAFKHPGVSEHKGGPEWAHGKGDDMHMSDNGMSFGTSNPDEATHMTGIHGHSQRNPRHEHIHRMLVRK
jgi:hypothetical protein